LEKLSAIKEKKQFMHCPRWNCWKAKVFPNVAKKKQSNWRKSDRTEILKKPACGDIAWGSTPSVSAIF